MPSGQTVLRLYSGMGMDSLNANFMRFFNNSLDSAGFGFYVGSSTVQALTISSTAITKI